MRKHLSFTIGVALSVVFIWLAFRNVHFAQLVQAYSRAHLWQVGVLVLAECFGLAVRGLRWYLLIAPGKKGTPWTVIKLETIGLALNNVLPFRLGELARATVGSSVLKTPIITLLATILVERILDMFSLGVIFMLAVLVNGGEKWTGAYSGIVAAMIVVLIIGLAALIFLDVLVERNARLRAFFARMPKTGKFVRQIAVGAESLRKLRFAVPIILLGFLLWFCDAFGYFWSAHTLGLNVVGFGRGLLLLCAGAFAVALPAVPGYFGTYELALQQVMVAWGVDQSSALAFATFLHINVYLVMTTLGIIFLYQMGHSLGGMWRSLKNAHAEAGNVGQNS